jgi:hypothetical protein
MGLGQIKARRKPVGSIHGIHDRRDLKGRAGAAWRVMMLRTIARVNTRFSPIDVRCIITNTAEGVNTRKSYP